VAKAGIGGVKVAYDAVGLVGGPVRGPLMPLDAAGADHVRGLLREAGLTA
jgi:dihydrodipicolinate synthase/N-acetylneuraminate lyase